MAKKAEQWVQRYELAGKTYDVWEDEAGDLYSTPKGVHPKEKTLGRVYGYEKKKK